MMSVDTIRVVLGRLQDDPESESAWEQLAEIVTAPGAGPDAEAVRLLEQARSRHERRREWASVARLLEIEISLAAGQPEEAAMQAELARIYDEELLAPAKARSAYDRLLELETPATMMEKASSYLESDEGRSAKWRDLYERYTSEAEQAGDDALRAGLLLSAADIAHRYGAEAIERVKLAELVEKAAALDPRTKRLAPVAEAILRDAPDAAAQALEAVLARGNNKEERVAAGLKAGRIRARRLNDQAKAIADYEQVLDLSPGQPDALSYLAEAYTQTEQWDHLVALYEDQLKGGSVRGEAELGILLQIAMVHWRMRKAPEAAEPYFERVRRADPAHAGMLGFFRELCAQKGDSAKLVAVLSDAQRATHDPAQKKELAAEIARAAEAQDNAQKAIEQYKSLLRADPTDAEAHAALKRLYAQTESWTALVDLLKHEAERVPADDHAAKASVLREIAAIYREKLKNEQALVQILTQIGQHDASDESSLRELVKIYEGLGRFRDLLTCQQRLAEVTKDEDERVELYRAVARRWADQFSNVQNAITSYEGLIAIRPRDEEARSKLKELYTKRRAWAPLFALYETALADAEGAEKIELLGEMAKLAAERLDRGADAIRLQKQILDIDPTSVHVYDALEKQAEREKDFATVAEVLERRVDATSDSAQKLAILQKLGAVYADRLKDNAGATKTWRRVLEISPGQAKALRVLREAYLAAEDYDALEQLYASQSDWEGLAEFLSSSADKAHDKDHKISLSFRAAAVYEIQLEAPERATRSYERILGVDVGNAQAAKALVPIYEKEERWARLPALYEVLLSVSDDDAERVAILRKLASVTSGPLPDRAAALGYARRAYDLVPDEDNLELLESASRAASSWGPFVEAIEARLAAAPKSGGKSKKKKDKDKDQEKPAGIDPKLERSLRLKLANAYARELGKIDEAVAAYRVLVEADPSDEETLREFDALLRASERKDDLRWLFELRVNAAPEGDRAKIYEEWATLEEDVFANAEEATKLYRKAAELAPERGETLKSLARLLLGAGDHAGAVEVLLRHRDLSEGAERAQREVELAFEYADHLKQPTLALEACLRAIELRPRDPDAIAILARLVDSPETRFRAATELATAYADLGDSRRESQMLRVVIEGEEDEARRLELHKILAEVEEKKLNAPGAAFDVVLRALNEAPGDLGLWDLAADLSSKSGRPTDLAESYRAHVVTTDPEHRRLTREVELELCDRAASLHDEQLGDPDGALPYLKRILAMDPQDQKAFSRLKQILTQAERWGEIEELFDQAAQASEDPAQKIALLSEVAMLAEEVIQLPQKAIAYHERILEIDPHVASSLDTLEKLYEDEERFGDLAALLERRLAMLTEEGAETDEAVDIRLYLGRLYLEQLLVPDRALAHVEAILSGRHEDADARELAERLLEIGSLRLRTAQLLESVYESRGEHRSLVRMLEIRLEAATKPEERAELLRRIGELRDEKLHDDAGAFAALSELVPLVPEDDGVRERFVEIGRRLGQHERVSEVLSTAAEKATTNAVKAELLTQVAAVYENALGSPERAEQVYRRVLAIDPDDSSIAIPAARALARIQADGGRHEALADSLEVEVKLEDSADTRKAIFERLGDLYETVLGNASKAIEAWRRRLADDDTDEKALVALERLYEKEGRFRDLVDVLRRREETSDDGDERKRAMSKAAEVLAGPLDDVPQATSAYRAVLDSFGADRAAHAALAKLYEKAERYQDLAEIIDVDLGVADETAERVRLYNKLGDVRRLHLGELESAIEAYRLALELDSSDAAARASLEAMLEGDAKSGAAELLHPLYEADGAAQKLLRVLEIEAEVAESPTERIEKLEKALATAEGSLNDQAAAYDYARRVVKEAASDESIGRQMETLERLTEATGRYAETCELYRTVSSDVIDGDVQLAMLLRVGDIAKSRLDKSDLAIEYYKKALDARPDEKKAMLALEELYQRREDHQALLDILRKRADLAESDAERKELLFREADLLRDRLEDKAGAIGVLEAVLEVDVDPRATSQLEALYTAESRFEDLVALYERMLEGTAAKGADAAALRVKIARTARHKLSDSPRAFDELVEALSQDTGHQGAVEELESILGQAKPDEEGGNDGVLEERARAAEMLEPIYLKQADWSKVKATLEARLDASQDPGERAELLKRLSTLHEDQLGDYAAALEATSRLLHEDITDRGVWSELERLARVASAEKRLADILAAELTKIDSDDSDTAELCKKTGEIYADLGERAAALKWFRRAHTFSPDSEELFDAIDGLLVKEGLHQERVDLMRGALDYRDGEHRVALLHIIADIEESKLARPEDAIETYRAALEVDERDTLSLDRLTDLYGRLAKHRDLADLYERRADSSESPEAAAPYRLALAKVRRQHLADPTGAIDQLETVVADVPWNRDAVAELESLSHEEEHKARVLEILRPLYQRADSWESLVKINEESLALAQDRSEKAAILRENAALLEQRGGDKRGAFEALLRALSVDPDDGEVRTSLERLAREQGSFGELASALESAQAGNVDDVTRRELLAMLARIYDEEIDDPRRALATFERLAAVSPGEAEPLDSIDELAVLLGDWSKVAGVIEKKVEEVSDAEAAELLRRLARTRAEMLEDESGAVAAYEKALELEPDSAQTMDSLIELYEAKASAERLVELYRQRVEISGPNDGDLRYDLNVRAAKLYEGPLENRKEAIASLGAALDSRPGDLEVLRHLERLYRAESMWDELLDNLKDQAARAEATSDRADLRVSIGDLYKDKLDSPVDALEQYRLVLEETPEHVAAAAAVMVIAESSAELRLDAAEILLPVLKSAERHADRVKVLELKLQAQAEPDARAATLKEIAEVHDQRLGKPADAEEALLRALAETPEEASLHDEIVRLAHVTRGESEGPGEGFKRYADALAERAADATDASVARGLWVRLGRVAEENLKDDKRAAEAFAKALDGAEGEESELLILTSLDRLYERLDDAKSLADVIERRVVVEPESAQAELYCRLAKLQVGAFRDPNAALGSLRTAIERDPTNAEATAQLEKLTEDRTLFEEVAETLEGVYRQSGDNKALSALFGKRITNASSASDRLKLRLDLARVLEDRAADPKAALDALLSALDDDPADSDVLAEIERVAAIVSGFEDAAKALEAATEKAADLPPETAGDLWIRAAMWRKDKLSDPAGAERDFEKALKHDSQNEVILRSIEEIQRAAGRERDLVSTLRRLAKIDGISGASELRREAFTIAEQRASDAALAEEILREVIAADEADAWALAELTRLRKQAGDAQETYKLLVRRTELAADGDSIRSLRHEAASVARSDLKDLASAIDLYEQIFEDLPTDEVAQTALRALYEETGKKKELLKLLGRLVDVADEPAKRSGLRLEAARVSDELEAPSDAIEQLVAILDEEPAHRDAALMLSRLYEKSGRDDELAELLEKQIELASSRGDLEGELSYRVRLGEVQEGRIGDLEKAAQTYAAVLDKDAKHKGALVALARIQEKRGDKAESAKYTERLLELEQGDEAVATAKKLASLYEGLGEVAGRRRSLERALAERDRDEDVRSKLRTLYEQEKDWEKLAELHKGDAQAASEPLDRVRLLRAAADIYKTKLSNAASAADLLQQASELAPSDRELLLALCDAYSESGRGKQAVEVLQKIVDSYGGRRSKEVAVIHHRLARAHLADGDRQKALAELDTAFKIDPGSISVLRDLGVLSLELADADVEQKDAYVDRAGKTFKALLLQRLDEGAPITKAEVFYYLGDVSHRQGDDKKAIQMLERALDNDKGFARAKELLAKLKG